MTGRWREGGKRRAAVAAVYSRADWRALISLARQCAADATGLKPSSGTAGPDAAHLRLMTLCRQADHASVVVLDRDAGATIADTGRAFLKVAAAFARPSTPAVTRQGLAPVIQALAAFLDDQLHELNTNEFQRAHAGRPEVWG